MNVCIYTSDQPSPASLLNINYLLQKRPEHNYSFLTILKPRMNQGFESKLKKIYGELRFDDGRYDFTRDTLTIDKKLKSLIVPVNKKLFINGYADQVNDDKSVKFLNEVKPDVIIQSDAGILKQNIFSLSKIATINVHHGIAPEIRGIASAFWCLFYGIKDKIGVTCHLIDDNLDTGAIICKRTLDSTSGSFIDIEFENYLLGRDVLVESIDLLNKGAYKVRTESDVKSYYFGMVNPYLYYALKKRNFEPVMKISDRAFKLKEKKYLEF